MTLFCQRGLAIRQLDRRSCLKHNNLLYSSTEILNHFEDMDTQPTQTKEKRIVLSDTTPHQTVKDIEHKKGKGKGKPSNYHILAQTMHAPIVLTE